MSKADTEVLDQERTAATADPDDAQQEGQGGDPEGGQQGVGGSGEGSQDDQVVITIGEESPPSEEEDENRAPTWVRELRKSNREKDRLLREREAEIAQLKGQSQPGAVIVGEKPTLESCNWDSDAFEQKLEAWHGRKRQADDEQRKRTDSQQAEQQAWQTRLQTYGKAKAELKVVDFDDAEAAVQDVMSVMQQGVILNGADRPEVVIYALGKNPKKAKELAAIADPVKFAFAVAKLETQLKVTPRKATPAPERVVRGAGSTGGVVDNQLERLRAEAAKTGDLTKVLAYKKQHRDSGK